MPSQQPGIQFGSGLLFATPVGGNLATNPTPQQVGIIQDLKLTVSGDIKELFGQLQFPVDTAVGKRSIKGSFNYAQLSNSFFNQMYFGDTVAPGIIQNQDQEVHNVPATTAYTITVANAAHFLGDLGVSYTTGIAAGTYLTQIPTGTPAQGQYTVNTTTGVYTFAAADASAGVLISYSFTNTTLGTTLTTGNHTMGWGPIVSLAVSFPYTGTGQSSILSIGLPNVRLGKIDFTTKIDDYLMMSTDFEAFAGASGNPINFYNNV